MNKIDELADALGEVRRVKHRGEISYGVEELPIWSIGCYTSRDSRGPSMSSIHSFAVLLGRQMFRVTWTPAWEETFRIAEGQNTAGEAMSAMSAKLSGPLTPQKISPGMRNMTTEKVRSLAE